MALSAATASDTPADSLRKVHGPAPRPIDHHPDGTPMTQAEIDAWWLTNVFRPNEPQLTPRAVITGMLLGGLLSLSNLYIGLKTGWGLAVTVTAAVLAFLGFKTLQRAVPRGPFKAEFTSLENNTMASAASAAGYFVGAGMTSAIPALYLTTGRVFTWWELSLWMLAISFLGVLLAVPMRRQMIDVDRLPFPEGLAYAETIRSLHAEPGQARRKSTVLFLAGILGAAVKLLSGPLGLIPEEFAVFGDSAAKLTLSLQTDLLMIGAGMMIGVRTCAGLAGGAFIGFFVLGHWLYGHGLAGEAPTFATVRTWILWPGVTMIVVNGLLAFGLRWRSALTALRGLGRMASGEQGGMASVEVPPRWFGRGLVVATIFVVVLARLFFGIPFWMGLLATALSAVLSIVACRATGETSITPVGALGKITQLMYGGLAAGNIQTNLMTASITAGAAMHSADLLTDLKGGYVLGSRPRYQFIAQFCGILAGAVFCIPAYYALATPERLGSPEAPAPAAMTWKAVAEVLASGIHREFRGETRVESRSLYGLLVTAVPPGLKPGDELLLSGGDAGNYRVGGIVDKTILLDHAPQRVGLHSKVQVNRGHGFVPATEGTTALIHAALLLPPPNGVRAGDYLQLTTPDGRELWWSVKGMLASVAVIDRPLNDPEHPEVTFEGRTMTVRKESLPPYAATAIVIAAIIAAIFTLLETLGPKAWRPWIPSSTGLGLGTMIAGTDSISMLLGSLIAWAWARLNPKQAEDYSLTTGSGIMAGASITGVGIIVVPILIGLFAHH